MVRSLKLFTVCVCVHTYTYVLSGVSLANGKSLSTVEQRLSECIVLSNSKPPLKKYEKMELERIRRVWQICFSKYSPTSLIRPKNTYKRESRISYDNDYKTSNPLVLNLFLCCNHMNILTSFSVSLLPFLMAITLSLIRTHFQFS